MSDMTKVPDTQKGITWSENQDSDALFAVFEKQKKKLMDALSDEGIEGIYHIGSSAIRGMPGPPMVDMLMLIDTWPPSEKMDKTMEELKFVFIGNAPHLQNDKWYKFVEEGKGSQDLGSGTVHIVHKDNKAAHENQILFAEFCNNNKEAFEAYKEIKLRAKEQGNFGDYKKEKTKFLQDLLPKAVEWKKKQLENGVN